MNSSLSWDREGVNASPPEPSPSQLTPAGRPPTPPPHLARMDFATPVASEELGLPVQSTLAPVRLAEASPSQVLAGPDRPAKNVGPDPAGPRTFPSSIVQDRAPLHRLSSHLAMGAEMGPTTPSPNGLPSAVGPSRMVSMPTSPALVVSPLGMTVSASLTPTPTSLAATNGSLTTNENSMNNVVRPQTPFNLDYPGDAGPSMVINVVAGNRSGVPAGDGQTDLHSPRRAVIPKVRANLRRVAGDLFTPHTVPIGPYHQDADSWPWTEEKKRAVHDLRGHGFDLPRLQQVLDGVQCRAREYYTHLPDDHAMDSGKFSSMLLHDGCYLLSLFLEYDCVQPPTRGGPSSSSSRGSSSSSGRTILSRDNTLVRDILYLLENQIPLFVIHQVMEDLRAHGEERSAFECIARPIENLLQRQLYISETRREAPTTSSHLLDLVYSYMASQQLQRQQQQEERTSGLRTGRWRRATEYRRYANLLFKRRAFAADEEWTILDVGFHGGSLWIPLLCVDSNTWTLLRNLMALEEQQEARPVTAYCYFMSQVACTAEDVELLRTAMVVEHFLGSDESAAQGFAGLCYGVALDIDSPQRNYLKPMWHDIEKRCSVPANNFKGFFREKYCSNVFYRCVFFIAFLVFVCQVVQSIYAVIAYHRPNNSAAAFRYP